MPKRSRVVATVLVAAAACGVTACTSAGGTTGGRPATAAEPVRSPAAAASADEQAAEAVRLADEYVREFVARFPEQAELAGLPVERHAGLTDNSLAALAEWRAFEDAMAARLAPLSLDALEGRPEWVTLGFLAEAVASSRQLRVCRNELWPVNALSGWQAGAAQLAGAQPVGTPEARADALARWALLPRNLDNEVANLREGLRLGYSAPRSIVRAVLEQLDSLVATPVEVWPFHSPADRDSDAEFVRAWRELLTAQVKPAVVRYRDFLRDVYLPAAREQLGIVGNPDGAACYDASFRAYPTLERSADETYRLGMARVERLRDEALAIGRNELGTADLPELVAKLRDDPANKFASREELLEFARAAVERSRAATPPMFARLPQATMVVEPYAAFLEEAASDSYWPAAEDGSRPATYRITLFRFATTTRSNAEITAFHEGYPGHHLQIAIGQELPAAHPITRLVGNSGFIEGWARYAEALAEELGLYSSAYARANRRLWPSRGMVVDPGLHLRGWTREQAVAWLVESGRFGAQEAERGIDRIAGWPAQLTAYDTGAIEIFALRAEAERALGDRFDLARFHSVVLDTGAITLPMLRRKVERWIAEQGGALRQGQVVKALVSSTGANVVFSGLR